MCGIHNGPGLASALCSPHDKADDQGGSSDRAGVARSDRGARGAIAHDFSPEAHPATDGGDGRPGGRGGASPQDPGGDRARAHDLATEVHPAADGRDARGGARPHVSRGGRACAEDPPTGAHHPAARRDGGRGTCPDDSGEYRASAQNLEAGAHHSAAGRDHRRGSCAHDTGGDRLDRRGRHLAHRRTRHPQDAAAAVERGQFREHRWVPRPHRECLARACPPRSATRTWRRGAHMRGQRGDVRTGARTLFGLLRKSAATGP
mmetsp:Transcript_152264/g.486559  ORF Transcript_152264/g.486559 Transcript_152264/m.486559 type:complete len:262 (+) Transcript_152264:87-872(+)